MTAPPDRSTAWIIAAAVVAAAALILVGGVVMALAMSDHNCCGHHRSGAAQTPFATTGTEATVDVRDYTFFPQDLTVDAGATVTWTNRGTAPHDATSDDGDWATDFLQKDDSGSIMFETPGEFAYHCSVHTYMKGVVRVRNR
jgi:plastocyanin